MKFVVFKTEDAVFKFKQKAVMEGLQLRKSSYEIEELDNLLDVISNQPDQINLASAEHPYFGFIALDLINAREGSVVCTNCREKYLFNQLEAFTVGGPDDATFKAASAKKGGLKRLFRKKPKPFKFGMYGGKGFSCPEGHELIFMITWRT